MLKIITSVVLSLVTIMAVTLFAVTVPAQSQKIEDNAAAIVKAQTDAETNAYNKVKEDILSDMSGSTLVDVGTAISSLQDDVETLENKHLYKHTLTILYSQTSYFNSIIINTSETEIKTYNALIALGRIPLYGKNASGYVFYADYTAQQWRVSDQSEGGYTVYNQFQITITDTIKQLI